MNWNDNTSYQKEEPKTDIISVKPEIILLSGKTGHGKSTAIKEMRKTLESNGMKVFVTDIDNLDIPFSFPKDYDFVIVEGNQYYFPDKIVILQREATHIRIVRPGYDNCRNENYTGSVTIPDYYISNDKTVEDLQNHINEFLEKTYQLKEV